MKPLHSILASLALAAFSTPAWAIQIPVTRDTAGNVTKNTIARTAGAAATLPISSKSTPLFFFDLSNSGITSDAVTAARLIVYFPKVTKPGKFGVRFPATAFQEIFTSATIPLPVVAGSSLDTDITLANSKGYVVIPGFQLAVQTWLGTPASNLGIALVADTALAALISSREGAGVGAAAILEIDVNPTGTLSTTTVTTSGAITSGGALTVTGLTVLNDNVFIQGNKSLTISGTGTISVGGNIDSSSTITANQNLRANQNITAGGSLTLGGSTSKFNVNTTGVGNITAVIRSDSASNLPLAAQGADGTTVFQVQDPRPVGGNSGVALSLPFGVGGQSGGGSWANTSDRRLKKNIEPLSGALDRLMQLRSVTYEYRDPAAIHELPGTQNGFIAQEVEPIFPAWVGEKADGMKFLAIKGFESLTVQALRELRAEKDAEIAALKQKVAALEARDALRVAIDATLQARLSRLEAATGSPTAVVTASLEQE